MTRRKLQVASSVLILAALALIVVGLDAARTAVWGFGLVTVGVAMTLSLATRWVGSGEE